MTSRLSSALSDRYRIERELGQGGMATVYLAHDVKHDRKVAIKVLRPELAAVLGAERFVQEIKTTANLQHPHILPLFDSGEVDGFLYYVMPYSKGETLRDKLNREKQLGIEEAVRIATEVADALDYAHRQNVIHRDIKPENILLHDGRPMVADFGIALAVTSAGRERLTETGFSLGTPHYMSPEQTVGDRKLDARSDVYSLGCVLYEMICGEPPFSGATAQAIVAKRFAEPVPRMTTLRESVPAAVEAVVGKALRKVPADRFTTARAFADALWVDTPPVGSAAERAQHRFWKPVALVAVVAVVVGTGWWMGQRFGGGDSLPIESLVVLPLVNLMGDPDQDYFVDGMHSALISELNQLDSLTVISRTSAARFRNSDLSVQAIADSLGVDAVMEGDVFRDGDSVRITASLIRARPERQLWTGTYTRNLRNLMSLHTEVTRAVAQEIEITLTPRVEARLAGAQEVDPEAYELYLRGNVLLGEYTEEAFWKAKENFEAAIARDSSYAVAYAGLASAYTQLGFYGAVPPREAESQVRAYATRALRLDEDLADARAAMASSLKEEWDWSGAERELRRAIALEPNSEFARLEYSSLLRALGRHEEALEQAEMALRLNPLSPLANIEAGFVYWDAERYEEAVRLVQKSIDLDSMHVNAHYTLGLAYGQLRRFDDAVTAMQRSVALSGGSPVRLSGLGWAYAVAGRPDSAAAILARLEQQAASVAVSPMLFAFIHTALGNHDRALELLEQAYDERSPFMRFLKVEPRLKPLRGEARFQALLHQMGLTN